MVKPCGYQITKGYSDNTKEEKDKLLFMFEKQYHQK